MRSLILFMALTVSTILPSVRAAERVTETYTITNGWSDSNSVYVVYEHLRELIHVSPLDIDGTIKSKHQKRLLARWSKSSLESLKVLELSSGDEAVSLIYLDDDFKLVQRDVGVDLVTRSGTIRLPACNEVIVPLSGIVRITDGLYYCGAIYSTDGKVVSQILAADKFKIAQLAGSTDGRAGVNRVTAPRWQIVCAQARLLFAREGFDSSSAGFQAASWSPKDGKIGTSVLPLPETTNRTDLQLETSSYSPSYFVLRPAGASGNWIVLCSIERCRKVSIPWRYSYIIVDGEKNKLILLRQGNLTSPSVQLGVVAFDADHSAP